MTIEVLISAMNQTDIGIAERTKCKTNTLIINQTDINDYCEGEINGYTVRMISTKERGLSRSRNMAVLNSEADICLLCDDDEILIDNYPEIITSAFNEFPEADIISFDWMLSNKIDEKRKYRKLFKYGKKNKAGKAPRFKVYSSVSLAFRRKRVIEKNVLFDERFGSGSGIISAGEESVWQNKAKRKGLKVYYYPELIAEITSEDSKWFKGYDEHFYYDLGACLSVNRPYLKHVFKYYYLINVRGTGMSRKQQLKWLNAGINGFGRNGYSYQNYIDSQMNYM